MSQQATVIGAGIIGLSSAYFLRRSGWDVRVIERGDLQDNCSYGNAGYVCPSHFIPLASPGIISQGLRWMLDARSPFYIQPRFNWGLLDWGMKFMAKATAQHVEDSAVPLRDIALLSQKHYEQWAGSPEFDFAYERRGLLEYVNTEAGKEHARHTTERALELGLEADFLKAEQVQAMEPGLRLNVLGAIYFSCDGHLYPNQLMQNLIAVLRADGVEFHTGETFTGVRGSTGRIEGVKTDRETYGTDLLVMATGSWSREVGKLLGVRIPLVAGRGYSLTLQDSPYELRHPAVLSEGKVAITPLPDRRIRFGGTMEITDTRTPPRPARVAGILRTVQQYLPDWQIPMPEPEQIWYGFRPCSADGLPYIDRLPGWKNGIVATGHSMLGISLGAGTGKLVSELAAGEQTSIPVDAFRLQRF